MEVTVYGFVLALTLENLLTIVLSLLDPLTVLRNTYTLDFIQIFIAFYIGAIVLRNNVKDFGVKGIFYLPTCFTYSLLGLLTFHRNSFLRNIFTPFIHWILTAFTLDNYLFIEQFYNF